MDSETQNPQTRIQRHKCAACYKQYKKKEHLVEHMRVSYHSVHQPKCQVCKKHCKTLESVREHLKGSLPQGNCAKIFSTLGCDLCLNVFDSPDAFRVHQNSCCWVPALSPVLQAEPLEEKCAQSEMGTSCCTVADDDNNCPTLVALDCEMVGGGSDGTLDVCAWVCLISEDENVLFHTYVEPLVPVTNFRCELTGIVEEHLIDAMPLVQFRQKIKEILYNGESVGRAYAVVGKARILVGRNLVCDLCSLRMNYLDHLVRDTAKYPPLLKINSISHSLKYLTQTYLRYEIQSGVHDSYEYCVAALRLYKRMRSQLYLTEGVSVSDGFTTVLDTENLRQL